MVQLYSDMVCTIQTSASEEKIRFSLSYLKKKEQSLLLFLLDNYRGEFTPIDVSRALAVTNKTIINRLAILAKSGFVLPLLVKTRIRSYVLSEYATEHAEDIRRLLSPRQP